MHRREYKRKAGDIALEEAAQIVKDSSDLENTIPDLIEKLASARIELRVSALQSFNEILGSRHVTFEELESFVDDIVNAVLNCLEDPQSRPEHEESLNAICNLSLNTFSSFEECAQVFLNEVMPSLPSLPEDQGTRFFAAAFVIAFSVHSQELCINALHHFISLITNKRARSSTYTPEMTAEAIRGVALMVSTFPETAIAETEREEIEKVLDKALESTKVPVLLAGLDLLQVVHEILVEVEENDNEETEKKENQNISRIFDGKYQNKLDGIPQLAVRKDDKAILRNACRDASEFLDGKEITTDLVLNQQNINLEGKRRELIVAAIKRVSKGHFQQQMSENSLIHSALGYELIETHAAQRLKKKFKKEIERERVLTTKERKQNLAKKRSQKEERTFNNTD